MYRSLLVLATGVFAIGTDSFVIAGILPQMAASLHVGTAAAGQLITAYALAYAVLSPVMGALTGNWPRKRLLVTGLAVFVLGNLATVTLPVFGLVLAGRIVAGAGGAMVTPAANAAGAALAPPEKRGRAIALVMTGLSAATALGSPLGTALAGLTGTWRATILFIAAVGLLSMLGVASLLPSIAAPVPLGLRERLTPVADARVMLTLGTTLLVYTGLFSVYSYIGIGFDRVTHGDGTTLALLLLVWGLAATAGTLGSGRLTDRLGNRRVLNTAVAVAAIDFALLPWSSRYLATSVLALVVWGLCGWGALTPQTHRLLSVFPHLAPVLTGLASATVYVGVSLAAAVGALGMAAVGPYGLGPFAAVLIALGLVCAELAHSAIRRREAPDRAAAPAVAAARRAE
ncbi:MFS transporter [Sphaerisporangium fuscum]|uniref:MFS transporter n=1 Tax=Sphaerisporangium fuscum TaxID=2835868 RepID=UPI001BDD63F5|nr:MFS transporter [Sphaerisporangium fuscum]